MLPCKRYSKMSYRIKNLDFIHSLLIPLFLRRIRHWPGLLRRREVNLKPVESKSLTLCLIHPLVMFLPQIPVAFHVLDVHLISRGKKWGSAAPQVTASTKPSSSSLSVTTLTRPSTSYLVTTPAKSSHSATAPTKPSTSCSVTTSAKTTFTTNPRNSPSGSCSSVLGSSDRSSLVCSPSTLA